MHPIDYETSATRQTFRWAWRYLIVGSLFSFLHLIGSFSYLSFDQPPGGQSDLFWTAVGPDGGHDPSDFLDIYELPLPVGTTFSRDTGGFNFPPYGVTSYPRFRLCSAFNGAVWGLLFVTLLHATWTSYRALGGHAKRKQ
jgi:hypothetical protein